MKEQAEYSNPHKDTHMSEPVIFRNFGHTPKTVTYSLPDFLYTYIIAGTGSVKVENENKQFVSGDSFVIARRQRPASSSCPTKEKKATFTLSTSVFPKWM